MAITKETRTTGEVLLDGQIQVKVCTIILEDGIIISTSLPHRHVVDVGANTSGEDQLIQDIAKEMHTPQRIAARDEVKRRGRPNG